MTVGGNSPGVKCPGGYVQGSESYTRRSMPVTSLHRTVIKWSAVSRKDRQRFKRRKDKYVLVSKLSDDSNKLRRVQYISHCRCHIAAESPSCGLDCCCSEDRNQGLDAHSRSQSINQNSFICRPVSQTNQKHKQK